MVDAQTQLVLVQRMLIRVMGTNCLPSFVLSPPVQHKLVGSHSQRAPPLKQTYESLWH